MLNKEKLQEFINQVNNKEGKEATAAFFKFAREQGFDPEKTEEWKSKMSELGLDDMRGLQTAVKELGGMDKINERLEALKELENKGKDDSTKLREAENRISVLEQENVKLKESSDGELNSYRDAVKIIIDAQTKEWPDEDKALLEGVSVAQQIKIIERLNKNNNGGDNPLKPGEPPTPASNRNGDDLCSKYNLDPEAFASNKRRWGSKYSDEEIAKWMASPKSKPYTMQKRQEKEKE